MRKYTDKELEIIYHQHSNQILRWIVENMEPGVLADLGSGHNYYVNALRHFGFESYGYDITNLHSVYQITTDVTEPLKLEVDYTLCFEVGEHIPPGKEKPLFDNICKAKKAAIVSWAKPGQEGIGHINCREHTFVRYEMAKRGFEVNEKKTRQLRKSNEGSHCDWFNENITYYERKESKETKKRA